MESLVCNGLQLSQWVRTMEIGVLWNEKNKPENADFQFYSAGEAILLWLEMLKNAEECWIPPSIANTKQC